MQAAFPKRGSARRSGPTEASGKKAWPRPMQPRLRLTREALNLGSGTVGVWPGVERTWHSLAPGLSGEPPEKGATPRGAESPVRFLDPWTTVGELETGAPGRTGQESTGTVPLENRREGRLVLGPLPALLGSVNGLGGRRGADRVPTPGTLCHAEERG
ncbi:hypothetical protein NDU88_004309 [Pleurodeles waltl]|uniref:Uncharacterized protein n=1 Tax=Pleurodeles waltl TaxID=8319 RepID=A0AAV7TR38_PLEWA|nr:hypothetical protein NDU88_004309 [Pleurodeles waltl]